MRKKNNWLAIIDYYDKIKEFDFYRSYHRSISLNRCARAFVRKEKLDTNISVVRRELFIDPSCNEEGVYDSPSMKEARERIFKNEL